MEPVNIMTYCSCDYTTLKDKREIILFGPDRSFTTGTYSQIPYYKRRGLLFCFSGKRTKKVVDLCRTLYLHGNIFLVIFESDFKQPDSTNFKQAHS